MVVKYIVMAKLVENYDAVVVGAGHAGVEAALARLKFRTIMFTVAVDKIKPLNT